MDQIQEHELPGDLSALAWVQEELRRTLDNAHKALRRHLRNLESAPDDAGDVSRSAALTQARNLMHQCVGALELISLAAPARVLRGSENALQRMAQREIEFDPVAIGTLERASFAVLDYLRRMLAGKPAPALSLFPQYRDVQALAGQQRVHPADLWADGLHVSTSAFDPAADVAEAADQKIRQRIEARLLPYFRTGEPEASRRMGEQFARLADASRGRSAELWNLASAFFEAQAAGLLETDLYAKRMASRLLAQLRAAERGHTDSPERLLQDLLFFCARARRDDASAPRLAAVCSAFGLDTVAEVDFESSPLGRFDPALIPVAQRRVAVLKETWSAVAAGELAALAAISEQAALVADSVQQIYPDGGRLAASLRAALDSAVAQGETPKPELAMEVATTLLCLDASLDEVDPDQPALRERIQRLSERLDLATSGQPAAPLEPWVEDLYRDVSDRQSMGSVVQELRAALAEIELQLDRFSRNPDEREALNSVPGQLGSMRGVLSVLGLDHASQAVQRMRENVLAAIDQRQDAAETTEALADNLGALSFLIDMLAVQPHLAKSLFRFDPATGRFAALMGHARPAAVAPAEAGIANQLAALVRGAADQSITPEALQRDLEGLADQATAADQADLADAAHQARKTLSQAMDDGDNPTVQAELAVALENLAAVSRPDEVPLPATMPMSIEDDSEDMQDVFIEEAGEVIVQAREALASLAADGQDLSALTTVRRAFHTLKGSSRMVGLQAFGEAAWACEQLFNARLADAVVQADPPLIAFTAEALTTLEGWVAGIGQSGPGIPADQGQSLIDAAQALRQALAVPTLLPPVEPLQAVPDISVDELPPLADMDEQIPVAELVDQGEPEMPPAEVEIALDLDVALPMDSVEAIEVIEAPELQAESWSETTHQPGGDLLAPEVDLELDLAALEDDEAVAVIPAASAPESAFESEPESQPAMPDLAVQSVEDAGPVIEPDLPAIEPDLAPEVPTYAGFATSEPELPALESVQPDGVDAVPSNPLPVEAALPDEPELAEVPDIAAEVPAQAELAPAEPESVELVDPVDEADRIKVVGPLRIQIALFNIFLNEADEQSRRLCVALSEWQHELHRPVGDAAVALAHSLAGNSATVGYQELSSLARRLEHALERSCGRGHGEPDEVALYLDLSEEIRRLLHQFAAGFLKAAAPDLLERLTHHEERDAAMHSRAGLLDQIEAVDAFDAPIDEVPTDELATDEAAEAPGWESSSMVPLNPLGEVRFSALEPAERSQTESVPVLGSHAGLTAAGSAFADDLDASDAIDSELFEIFVEEGEELLPSLTEQLRLWEQAPAETDAGVAAMRALHTFKGGARLAGAMRLGELAHRLETAIEKLIGRNQADETVIARLHQGADALSEEFQRLRQGGAALFAAEAVDGGLIETEGFAEHAGLEPLPLASVHGDLDAPAEFHLPELVDLSALGLPEAIDTPIEAAESAPEDLGVVAPELASAPEALAAVNEVAAAPAVIDWAGFAARRAGADASARIAPAELAAVGTVRVRAPLLDRMVSQAGEVGIARARIESDMVQMQGGLKELTDNLERLRRQLRDLELQAETQMASRIEAARSSQQSFDPLEMDRFTRVQELTRMLAESVGDVGTVQRGLQQMLQNTEDQLAVQARLNRDLQDDLLRARMVEFDTLSDRLYRVVRQAAKESGKQVRLNFAGGGIELDRAVLDRMAPAFEHLLRNAVVHGIEAPGIREALGKNASGTIDVALRQSGNEVEVEVRDDGAGLNLARIADRAMGMGLLNAESRPTEGELAGLIFTPGFSTADQVTELAGRGVGMDVVRSEVTAMGGRIETASSSGQGTAFRMLLPLTTAVTQVVLLQCGSQTVAVPSTLVELVRRVPAAEVEQGYQSGVLKHGDLEVPFFWLGSLLQQGLRGPAEGRNLPVVIVRSAAQRVAVHVSQVLGNQEAVVKNLGPQLSRLPGLAGMSLMANGQPVLIYNPVALAAVYGTDVRQRLLSAPQESYDTMASMVVAEPVVQAPLVMVVDDSLTVRRVTQRLLQREGYRVALAKDGLDALERLAVETPAVMLCDIEMPRMDGFDLVHNLRADPRLAHLPVIMITSRIADKHQEHARELGVNHYLGKPYDEELLLSLVKEYASAEQPV